MTANCATENMGINTNGKRGPSPKKNVAALKKARMNASGTGKLTSLHFVLPLAMATARLHVMVHAPRGILPPRAFLVRPTIRSTTRSPQVRLIVSSTNKAATPTTKPSAPSKLSQPPTNAKPSSSLASGAGSGSGSGQGPGHGRAGSIAGSTYSAHSQQSGGGRSTSETPSFGTGLSASQQSAAGGCGGVTSKGHGHGQGHGQGQAQVEGSKARKTVTIPGKGSVPPPKCELAHLLPRLWRRSRERIRPDVQSWWTDS